MGETISFHQIIKILKKRWKLIAFSILLGALISSGVTFFLLTPIYQATTQILVNQRDSDNPLDVYQLQSNKEVVNTYSVIMKSPVIMNDVIERLRLTENVEELNKKISITSYENSFVFSLTVEYDNPNMATDIANTIPEVFQEKIQTIMNVDNVSILARAEERENPIPVFPKPIFNIVIGTLLGVLIGIGLSILLEYLNRTLKDATDVEECLGLPVIGVVQKIPKKISKNDQFIEHSEVKAIE